MRRWIPGLIGLLVVSLMSCLPDFDKPSDNAQITCTDNTQCPTDWICNTTIGECVKADKIDTTAPALIGEAVVEPGLLKKDAVSVLSFEVSEDLKGEPEVSVKLGNSTRLFVLDKDNSKGRNYVYTYTAAGDEPELGDSPITLVLMDKYGNKSSGISGGKLLFDFTVPKVISPVISGSPAKKDATVTLTFDVNEALKSDPVVAFGSVVGARHALPMTPVRHSRAGGNPEKSDWVPAYAGTTIMNTFEKSPSSSGLKYVYTYKATGNESQDLAGQALTIDLVDQAGNAASATAESKVVFDFIKPSLVGEPTISPEYATMLGSVTVLFESDSELSVDPEVTLGGLPMAKSIKAGNKYTYTYIVSSTDTEGTKPVSIKLTDLAGNETTSGAVKAVVFDFTAPQVTGISVNPQKVSAINPNFNVKFTLNKPPREQNGILVKVSGNDGDLPLTPESTCKGPGEQDYCYKGAIPSAGTTLFYAVSIQVWDKAGNQKIESAGTLEADNVPPQLAGLEISPKAAKFGTTMTIVLSANEVLKYAPTLVAYNTGNPSKTIMFVSPDAAKEQLSYSYQATVGAGAEDGKYKLLAFKLKDVAENESAEITRPDEMDVTATVPAVTNIAVNKTQFSKQANFNSLEVKFDCPKDVGAGLDVKIGGEKVTCNPWKSTSPNYECAYDVSTTGLSDGSQIISMATQDAAGNTGSGSKTVEFDFIGPTLALSVTPDTRPAKLNENLVITVSSNETLETAGPTLGTGDLNMGTATKTGNTYTWTRNTTSSDQGTYNVTADAKDEVGNPATQKTGTAKVDGKIPAITNVATNRAIYSKVTNYSGTNYADLQLTFNCVKDVKSSGTLSVKVDTVEIGSSCTYSSPTYTCTYDVSTYGSTDGVKNISITATDSAGNVSTGSKVVTFDFGGPTLAMTVEPTPAVRPARYGENLVVTVSSSEDLDASGVVLGATGGLSMGSPSKSGNTYTWTRSTGLERLTSSLTADAHDTVGNPSNTATGTAKLDGIKTVISNTSLTSNNYYPALAMNGDKVTAFFDTDKDLPSNPSVTLGGKTMTFESKTGTTPPFTYKYYRNAANGDGDGPKIASVFATDLAGNTGTLDFGGVTYDLTNPAVASSSGSPNPAGVGAEISYVMTSTEPLKTNPTLNVSPILGFTGPAVAGNTYTWKYTVQSTDTPTTYTATFNMTDLAGNNDPAVPGSTFKIDTVYPVITPVSLLSNNANDTTLARDGNVVTATFIVDKDLQSNPIVTLGGKSMTFDSRTGTTPPYTYKYIRTVITSDGDGAKRASVMATDTAGNISIIDFGGVTLDFTPPNYSAGSSVVQLLSDFPANPVANVTTVTNGTTVAVTFSLTESIFVHPTNPPLSSPKPKVVACKVASCTPTNAGEVIELDLDTGSSGSQVFRFTKKISGIATGSQFASNIYMLPGSAGGVFDTAGNVQGNTITIGQFNVNTVQPSSPSVANVYYKRIPWGMKDPNTGNFIEKKFSIVCNACQFASTVQMVLAYDSSTPSAGGLIGSATNPGTGNPWSFTEIILNGSDRAHVWMAVSDAAGNISPATEVKSAEWIATMGYKVPGSTFENPHVFAAAGIHQQKLIQDQYLDEPEIFKAGGFQRVSQIGKQNWKERTPPEEFITPAMRSSHALAYDSARGKVVLFGGYEGPTGWLNDTWEWDGTVWVRRTPATSPPKMSGPALAYDSARDKVVLFAGSDTWEWNGENWARKVLTANPPTRSGHDLAYDSGRGKVVLFGGLGSSVRLNDTWEYDGTNWIQKFPASSPPIRNGHSLAYDSARGRVVLFGGESSAGNPRNDTWEWNGTNWIQKFPASSPPVRNGHSLAYDSAGGRVVLFGGESSAGSLRNDTWDWDGTNWTQKFPASSPSARYFHALAYDNARSKVVLFGGNTPGLSNDTWEWDGTSWTQKIPASNPPVRSGHALAYDSARGKTVLFGGSVSYRLNDTWEWDGSSWTQKASGGPPTRERHALAYDSARGKTVLFGGYGYSGILLNDTWEWDGASWTQKFPVINNPIGRAGHALAYDSGRGKVVLFGGCAEYYPSGSCKSLKNDAWEWDGTNWTERTPAQSPTARDRHALTYDIARGRVVLFGGSTPGKLNDTWEWDGTSWMQKTTASNPPERVDHSLAYDSARSRVVLFGGHSTTRLNDTWEWDGTSWTQKIPASSPPARSGHALAYDSARGKILLFGGGSDSGILNDTWEWDGASWMQKIPTSNPSARYWHALAYDSARGKVVLFGGTDGFTAKNDTWEWDGASWMQKIPTSSPSARYTHALAYDSNRNKVVLFGGFRTTALNETWEWDGENWVQKFPASSPPARYRHALVHDSARGKVMLFGGLDPAKNLLNDTWEWNGTDWTRKFPASSPPERADHSLANDSFRGKVVLFGGTDGSTAKNDTWEWDGESWVQKFPASSPPARSRHALAPDSARGKVMLSGGNGNSGNLNDTWEWNGTSWMQKAPAYNPSERADHSLAYDSAGGRVVLFGGNSTTILNDTWEWEGQGDGFPGHQIDLAVMATGVLRGAFRAEIQQVSVRLVTGGTGYPAGVVTNGVNLLAWYDNKWNSLASNSDDPKSPGLVEKVITDSGLIQKLILNPAQSYNFAVVPQAQNGFGHPNCPADWTAEECDMGMVSTEYVEVTLKYMLP